MGLICLICVISSAVSSMSEAYDESEASMRFLELSSIMIEGYGIEDDPTILGINVNPDDVVSWVSSGVPVYSNGNELFLISDIHSLGIEVLKSKSGGLAGLESFKIAHYQLTARFPTGLWLPISSFAVRDSLVLLRVPNSNLVFENFDYVIPERIADYSLAQPLDPVIVIGPSLGSGQSHLDPSISSIPGIGRTGGLYNFSSRIRLNQGQLTPEYMGSPVFISHNDNFFLLGLLSIYGPEANIASYVSPIPLYEDMLHEFSDWHEVNEQGLTDYIESAGN